MHTAQSQEQAQEDCGTVREVCMANRERYISALEYIYLKLDGKSAVH